MHLKACAPSFRRTSRVQPESTNETGGAPGSLEPETDGGLVILVDDRPPPTLEFCEKHLKDFLTCVSYIAPQSAFLTRVINTF